MSLNFVGKFTSTQAAQIQNLGKVSENCQVKKINLKKWDKI
jgi:hypothetical protein